MNKIFLDNHTIDQYGFPVIDWEKIDQELPDNLSEEELHNSYIDITRSWFNCMHKRVPSFKISQSKNFFLLSSFDKKQEKRFLRFLEKTLSLIISTLEGIANDDGWGKHVVFAFDNQDDYYEYISQIYPDEGSFSLSTGMYINRGYGHLSFPVQDMGINEVVAIHEMTHACLSHLPIPDWLNEGLAQILEGAYSDNFHFFELTEDDLRTHKEFWNYDYLQQFWSGVSFRKPESSELSYDLALIITRRILSDFKDETKFFVNEANWSDGGNSAAKKYFRMPISHLVTSFVDVEDTEPNPAYWEKFYDS